MSHLSHIAFCSGTAATDSTTGAAVGAAPGTGAISWGCSILGRTVTQRVDDETMGRRYHFGLIWKKRYTPKLPFLDGKWSSIIKFEVYLISLQTTWFWCWAVLGSPNFLMAKALTEKDYTVFDVGKQKAEILGVGGTPKIAAETPCL